MFIFLERIQFLVEHSYYSCTVSAEHLTLQLLLFCFPGYYGNEIDGVIKPNAQGKKGRGDGDEEETELIHNSSEEEIEDDGDLTSVATTPPMKPVVTDRSGQKYHIIIEGQCK